MPGLISIYPEDYDNGFVRYPSDSPTGMSAPPIKKACDACHRRKVRCTGGQPCRNCGQASLQCTYLAVPQKKGPKGSRAKVISELRDTQSQTGRRDLSAIDSTNRNFNFNTVPVSPTEVEGDSNPLDYETIESCLDFFFSYMYQTIPILDRRHTTELASSDLSQDAETFCLVASLCAWVLIQPGMNTVTSPGVDGDQSPARYALATTLLSEVKRLRKTLDLVENPSLLSVRTSFFLFGAYFSLEQQNQAWFHLREAATVAQLLDMHEEASYLSGDHSENVYRRRLYWLLLLTERAYSMERHRPLTLQPTIELPSVDELPGEAAIVSGFLCLINLFRVIDDDFIGLWNKSRSECSTSWLAQLQQKLTDAIPTTLQCTEIQAADIRVTQQWLRIMVWQLSIMNGNLSSSSSDSAMTFQYPIEVARNLIHDLSALPQSALEVHGVGLIEKIFDVACTLTDVIALVPFERPSYGSGPSPSDYLNQFLEMISRLRDGASRFLPLLLNKISENLPSMVGPAYGTPGSSTQEYNLTALSPGSLSQSATMMTGSPLTPYSSIGKPPLVTSVSDPGAMSYSIYTPPTPAVEAHMTQTSGAPIAPMAAPIPRSMPRFPFEGYVG